MVESCRRLTVILPGTHFAASSGQEDWVGTRGLRALRLDILTRHTTNDSSFLVNLEREAIIKLLCLELPYQVIQIGPTGHLCLFWLELS